MAIVPATGIASFDLRNAVPIDVADMLYTAIAADDPRFSLLPNIGFGEDAEDTTYKWLEYKPQEYKVTLNESVDITAASTDNVFTLAAGHVERVRIGALLQDTTPGKRETVMVLDISGNDITVLRGYPDQATNLETHAKDSVWERIGSPKQEGADASVDPFKDRDWASNVTQIFERGLKISGTAQKIKKYAISSEFDFQMQELTLQIKREIAMTVIRGVRSTTAGSDTELHTMDGIMRFLMQSGGNVNTTAEAVSLTVLNDMVKMVWDDAAGSAQNLRFVCSGTQMKKIQAIVPTGYQLTMTQDSRTLGDYVADFQSDLGIKIPFTTDPYVPADVIMLLDMSRIQLHNLRPLEIRPVPTKADAKEAAILTELTLSVKNAKEAHAVHTNLSTT